MRRRASRFGAFRRSRGGGRGPVGRKSGTQGALLLLLVGGVMMLQAFAMSSQCVGGFVRAIEARAIEDRAIEDRAGTKSTTDAIGIGGGAHMSRPPAALRRAWPDDPGREKTLLVLLGGTLCILSLAILFTTLGTAKQDLGRVTWSTEWLFTFPVSARSLFLSRLGEYALTDLFTWIAVFPFLTVVFSRSGRGWSAPVLGAAATLAVAAMLAAARLTIETWLRKRFTLSRLKNVQAVCTVLGVGLIFVTLYLALHPPVPDGVVEAAETVSPAALWFPLALPVLLADSWPSLVALLLVAAAAAGLAVGLSARLVRDGLLSSTGSVLRGARGKGAAPARPPVLRGILGKEIRLLLRDRNFFVQTLLLPLFIIGFQALVNPSLFGQGSGLTGAIVAYGVGAYVLMFGAFSVLAVERESLWLLWTFPQSLARLLRRKATLWAGAASLYTLGVLVAWRPGPSPGVRVLAAPVMALVGTVLSAFVATGIAALGTDPFDDRPNRRVRTQYVYLYMFLATAFGYGIWAPSLWVKFVLVVLYSLLAVALWQKAEERLPLLLDPTVSPPKRISLADGLIYALVFFLLQSIAQLLFLVAEVASPDVVLLLAYVTAGLVTVLIALSALPPGTLADMVRFGEAPAYRPFRARFLLTGVQLGAVVGACGLAWRVAVEHVEFLREARNEWLKLAGGYEPGSLVVIGLLAVVAAPLFEEFLFRGIVFRGLGRAFRPAPAMVASALVFAVVHPPVGFPAIFLLGFTAAFVYHRTRSLPAAIALHATYNAIVLLFA